MKKLYALFIGVAILTGTVLTALSLDKKDYGSTQDGCLYFVLWTTNLSNGATATYTNKETYMWAPLDIRAIYADKPNASTLTVDHVSVETFNVYPTNTVTTNEFGVTVTNIFNEITNTVTAYITNQIISCTNGGTDFVGTGASTIYIKKGDLLNFTFSPPSPRRVKITATR